MPPPPVAAGAMPSPAMMHAPPSWNYSSVPQSPYPSVYPGAEMQMWQHRAAYAEQRAQFLEQQCNALMAQLTQQSNRAAAAEKLALAQRSKLKKLEQQIKTAGAHAA
jgi:hypothetical protein